MKTLSTLGDNLKTLRKTKKWTLEDAVFESGYAVSASYLCELENDKISNPSPHILAALADTYAVEYNFFMRLAGYPVCVTNGVWTTLTDEEAMFLNQYLIFFREGSVSGETFRNSD